MDFWVCQCGKKVSENMNVCPHCRTGRPGADVATVATSGGTVRAQQVVIVDFDMPFMSIVLLLVKWAVASIPAALIISLLYLILFFVAKTIGVFS
jgi:hypothetical protein